MLQRAATSLHQHVAVCCVATAASQPRLSLSLFDCCFVCLFVRSTVLLALRPRLSSVSPGGSLDLTGGAQHDTNVELLLSAQATCWSKMKRCFLGRSCMCSSCDTLYDTVFVVGKGSGREDV